MSEVSLYGDELDRGSAADDLAISPIQLLLSLKRSWPLILVCGVLFAAAGYAYTVTSVPKKYTTSATIAVQQPQINIPVLAGAVNSDSTPDPMPIVRSEMQVLTSRALIQQVADALNLQVDPEFNATLRPPTPTEMFKRRISAGLPTFLSEPLVNVGLLPDTTKPDEPAPPNVVRDSVIGSVLGDLSIINDNRSLIVVVQFTALEPDTASRVINTLLKLYVQDRAQGRATANVDANSELAQRVQATRNDIDALEAKIAATREKYNLVQTRSGTVGQQQLEDLSAAVTRASADRAAAIANYQRASALARTGGPIANDNAAVLGSSTIGALRDREAAAQRQIAQLSTTLGPANPQLKAAEAQLGSARAALAAEAQRVVTSLGATADAAAAREADLKRQLDVAEKSAGGLANVQSELTQLEKDADSRRVIYQTLLQGEAQTASKKVGSDDTGVRVVSTAVPPAYPSSPKPKVAGVLGMMSGCAFGGFIALMRGRRDKGFATPDDFIQSVGIAPLAVLPRAGRRALADRVIADPSGEEAEALRALRTKLRFSGRSSAPHSVLFVSSVTAEDSADVAAAFARVAAIDGLRVLLLEGDLQAPSLARRLSTPASNGFIEALQGRQHWQDLVEHDGPTGLDFLLAANAPRGSGQLLESMQLQNLLAEARDDYNVVVMTGHAVGDGSQTVLVANIVETTVLVVGAKQSRKSDVRSAVRTLSSTTKKRPVLALRRAS